MVLRDASASKNLQRSGVKDFAQDATTDDSGFYTCTAGNILGETVSDF